MSASLLRWIASLARQRPCEPAVVSLDLAGETVAIETGVPSLERVFVVAVDGTDGGGSALPGGGRAQG